MDQKKKKRKSTKRKRKTNRGRLKLIILAAVLVVAAVGAWQSCSMLSGYKGKEAVWLRIPNGSSKAAVVDSLKARLGDEFGGNVADYWDGDTAVVRGAYKIEPGDKAYSIAHRLNNGRQTPVKLTFNNIRTIDQLSERLAERMDWRDGDFKAAFLAAADSLEVTREMMVGRMMPDTYEVYWTDSPEKVLKKILGNYDAFWNEERCNKADELGLTPDEVAVVASIAEEETSKADERGKVARLYINRLNKGMRLQADPTVKFAVGDFSIQRIGGKMLSNPSPYNTYRYAGLPPGPIRIPDRKTLDAVLNALAHNYIYMCAKSDLSGYHDFTSDFATHQQNALRFRQALDARGIALSK
jgi:UPF0755 protein